MVLTGHAISSKHSLSPRPRRYPEVRNPIPATSLELSEPPPADSAPVNPIFQRVRRVGLLLLTLQLALLIAWSVVEANRHVQAGDFVGFYRAWYLISHGTFNPSGWWSGQAVFIIWPLAIFGLIWPHPVTLLVIQDLAIVGAETVAFYWITDILRARREAPFVVLSSLALVLFVADPWIYSTASWDFHSEPVGVLFAVLAARDFYRGRSRAWIWSAITLLCGMVPITYVVGIGLSLLISSKRRLAGLILVFVAAAWFLILVKLGAGNTLPGTPVGYPSRTPNPVTIISGGQVAGVFHEVITAIRNMHRDWLDVYANISPAGVIGVLATPVIGITAVTLGENSAFTYIGPITPSFQNLPIYIFAPIGTILILAWLYRRKARLVAHALIVLMATNAIFWGAVWIPQIPTTWLRVSPAQANALSRVIARIPERDAVVASQGIVGSFAGRDHVGTLYSWPPLRVALHPPATWFVIAPYAGIETETVTQSMGIIHSLASDPLVKFISEDDGIWVFRAQVSPTARAPSVLFPKTPHALAAGLFETTVGTREINGSPNNSQFLSRGTAGYLLWGDYWLETRGHYTATVRFRSSGPINIQVWNDTTNSLLVHRQYSSTNGLVTFRANVQIKATDPSTSNSAGEIYLGRSLFRALPVPAFPGNYLEVRVVLVGNANARIYSVGIMPIKAP